MRAAVDDEEALNLYCVDKLDPLPPDRSSPNDLKAGLGTPPEPLTI